MLKSAALLIATNLAVMVVISAIFAGLSALGIVPQGWSARFLPLIIMSAVMGFGGAFVSLLMSKGAAVRSVGARVIETPGSATETWLVNTIQKLSEEAGIKMPEVAIFDSTDMNAFATGPSKNRSLIAVSTGLLQGMSKPEVEAVLGHELSHAANGDMVSMTLIQGVTNTFVIVFANIIGTTVDRMLSGGRRSRRRGFGFTIAYMVANAVLGFLATIIVRWFSRRREFRADRGSAKLTSPGSMAAALERLKSQEPPMLPASMQAMGISGNMKSLFATHPSLDDRIAALRKLG